jgi:VanZ family protein
MTLITFQTKPFVRRISVLLIMPIYAAFDELTQPLVNRHAAWGDWFANVFGSLAALILIELILIGVSRISPKPSRSQIPGA